MKKTKNAKAKIKVAPKETGRASANAAPARRPNILMTMGDDIGMWNVGAYTHGMMGHTPKKALEKAQQTMEQPRGSSN